MKSQQITLEIPEELVETLEIEKKEAIEVKLTDQGVLYSFTNNTKRKVVPLLPVLIATIIVALAMALVYRPYSQIPLIGDRSMATVVIIAGVITGSFNFTYFFTKNKAKSGGFSSQKIYWRNYPVVLLTFILLLIMTLSFSFWLIGQLFLGVSFDIYTAAFLGGVIVGVINYIMIEFALTLTPKLMMRSLIIIILSGAAIAMITNRDQQWWLYNFSFLGTPEATRNWQFNITLIISALQMISLIDYLFVLLYDTIGKNVRLRILKALLVATAFCLAGVGIFPYNDNLFYQMMHNRVAGYLVYLFIIMIIAIRWLLPTVSKHFLKLSYLMGAILVLACILFLVVHYLSLTVFELLAFVIAFSWLLLLIQYLIQIVETHGKVFKLVIVNKEKN